MSKGRKNRRKLGGVIVQVGVVACWAAVYYGFFLLLKPDTLLKQLLNAFLSNLVIFAIMGSIGYFFGHHKRIDFFQKVTSSIRRIGQGDFSVSLDWNKDHPYHPLGELVASINEMAGQLNQMEQMRQEFISNVSHEIQSPLTSISGFARALQNDRLSPAERKHYLEIIETECRRLSKLSDNLLKLTSLESRHHPFEPKSYRLDRQLRSIVLACEPQWREKEIEMDIALAEVTIFADEDLLSQVWTNLIHNAIKFTPNGGTIGIYLEQHGREVTIRISDTGIGIPEEDQSRIFERFYKADKSRNRTNSGSGLGLSIVKKIVEMHNGRIAVRSVPGEGAVFTVTLPARPASPHTA
ncbi:HAMP domain-containing histidine kinase [Brevibacillus sp. SYP-B805]|uniref:HAMP domain-containing sensor histidine kinase n=1 Tax=Brevibacillus sp. SYP-B805 TaxID=1578199 RepID=UPI0013E9CFFE|nr:HAMP domain-containing sensor histidine kinase [Brevibacillus sp. SYP-B805]NGQ96017.1 HAMP domain-containing histidine kinase [Brevibacillus sp. SYP-B805]